MVTYSHKSRCNALTPWSRPTVVFPPNNRARNRRIVSPKPPRIPPTIAPLCEWHDLEDVRMSLSRFYENRMRFTVTHVPEVVTTRMMTFLNTVGDMTPFPPIWVCWEQNRHRDVTGFS